MPGRDATPRWLPLSEAASFLGESPVTLRRRCAANARPPIDGVVEARFDGLIARRLGGTWRIWLAAGWSDPLASPATAAPDGRVLPSPHGSARHDGKGSR